MSNRTNQVPLDVLYPYGYSGGMFTVRQTEAFVAWLDALKLASELGDDL